MPALVTDGCVVRKLLAPFGHTSEFLDFAKGKLALQKYPRWFEWRESLPEYGRGKVARKELNDELATRSGGATRSPRYAHEGPARCRADALGSPQSLTRVAVHA